MRGKPRIIAALLIIVMIVLGVLSQLQVFSIFQVKKIDCSLNQQPCPTEVNQRIDNLKNQSLFFTNFDVLMTDDLADSHYQLISLKKKLPQTLILELSDQQPLYQLQVEEEYFNLYPNGQAKLAELNLDNPQVSIKPAWSYQLENQTLDSPTHQTISKLVQELNDQQINFQAITLYDQNLIAVQLNTKLIALLETNHLSDNVQRLAIINQELDLASIDLAIKEIDLRFKLPVLRTSSSLPS